MANTKWQYVRKFELADVCLPNAWMVVRLDGCSFKQFSNLHKFQKPNDPTALNLMSHAAKNVMTHYKDIRVAYGQSDEYSFVFWKETNAWNRRLSKVLSIVTSRFTSSYTSNWSKFFPNNPLKEAPVFDGRVVLYPDDRNMMDYLKWRQADCHINNLYNTTFWKLVLQGGLDNAEAERRLCGSTSADKNEMLFSTFNTNYNNEPAMYRKGTVLWKGAKGDEIYSDSISIIDDQFWNENGHLLLK